MQQELIRPMLAKDTERDKVKKKKGKRRRKQMIRIQEKTINYLIRIDIFNHLIYGSFIPHSILSQSLSQFISSDKSGENQTGIENVNGECAIASAIGGKFMNMS